MHPERRRVLVGLGRIGRGVLAAAPPAWIVTVVDVDAAQLDAIPRPVTRVVGDASSRLVLARCGLGPASTLVIATGDDAVNAEVARLAKAEFGVEDAVAVFAGQAPPGIDAVDRADAVVRLLRRRVDGLDAGAGRGELRQVPVLPGSPVIGRPLRELHHGAWLVAMVYRGDDLVVPNGDTRLAEGDRVLLAGDPAEIASVATYVRGGLPTFPAAWGRRIGWLDPVAQGAAAWLQARTTAVEGVAVSADAAADADRLAAAVRALDVGCLVVGPRPLPWLARVGVVAASWPGIARAAQVPLFVVRGTGAPTRVVVAIGPGHDARVIAGVGLDLARQAQLPLALLTVRPSAASTEAEVGGDPLADALRYARLHGLEPERIVDEGNPIARIRAHAGPDDLLVVGFGPPRRSSVFAPDVGQYLLHDAPGSTLFVPWERG